jgi:uncharacterized protein YhaN
MCVCRESRNEARRQYQASDPETVRARLDNLEEVLTASRATVQSDQRMLAALRTELEVRGESGLAGQLAAAASALSHAKRAHEAYTARANAARLLHDTMSAARAEARRAYVRPLKDKIESLSRLVFGPTIALELGDDLRISARVLGGQRVEFTSLSCGAREQLSVISRLACACLVSKFGGVPIILDDSLGYSDPSRLAAMGAVLALAGRTCQILVLTCVPERYRGVGGATVIPLTAECPLPLSA